MLDTQQLSLWADKLRDISATGLRFAQNVYDREHFQTVQDIALAMFAAASHVPVEKLEPLRGPVFSRPTPYTVGDAAVINDDGEILLIQRADNGLWAMPGGGLEVGETPAQGVMREAFEESGVQCEAVALVGVFDSRFCGTASRHHLYQFLFLCRPLHLGAPNEASHAHEVLDVQWFAEEQLPPPQDIDPGHVTRIPEAFRVWRGDDVVYFDR
jgi:ADP-ribose pyrophosphatase YjhB (NUDIX family)